MPEAAKFSSKLEPAAATAELMTALYSGLLEEGLSPPPRAAQGSDAGIFDRQGGAVERD